MIVAHAGHWAVQLLYAVPVLFVVGAIIWSKIQEKREAAEEAEEGLKTDPDGRD